MFVNRSVKNKVSRPFQEMMEVCEKPVTIWSLQVSYPSFCSNHSLIIKVKKKNLNLTELCSLFLQNTVFFLK